MRYLRPSKALSLLQQWWHGGRISVEKVYETVTCYRVRCEDMIVGHDYLSWAGAVRCAIWNLAHGNITDPRTGRFPRCLQAAAFWSKRIWDDGTVRKVLGF